MRYETQYFNILKEIDERGFLEKNERTQVRVKRIPHAVISVDLQREFPILKSKIVYWKNALKEILWIMQKQSNNISDLDTHIWDDWADENGSIGKAYGYQVGKMMNDGERNYKSQVHYVLERLKADPSDRRALIDLWNVDELEDMALVPCCFSSHWTIINGSLNCLLMQRSADFLLGVPFNTTQYAMLTILFANHLGVKPGKLTHAMSDAHIYQYSSHIEGCRKMIDNYENLSMLGNMSWEEALRLNERAQKIREIAVTEPHFEIVSEETDFFKVKIDDCVLRNYNGMEKIKFDVAV